MRSPTTRRRVLGACATVGGIALFVWSLRNAGLEQSVEGARRVGVGFVAVLALGGLRAWLRAAAWRVCLDPRAGRVRLRGLFAACLAGDAIGNVTPFGLLISEPSKVALVRGGVDVAGAAASLAVENLCYGASAGVIIGAGALTLATRTAASARIRAAGFLLAAVIVFVAAAATWTLRNGRRVLAVARRALPVGGRTIERLGRERPRFEAIASQVAAFRRRRPDAIVPVLALEALYHAAAVGEVWLVVGWITGSYPSALTAVLLEAVNRAITIGFQFVPMWLGVDEAGTGGATGMIGLGASVGVSLALVRKARTLFWTAAGLSIVAIRGARRTRVTRTLKPVA